ncbi:MAG: c-type cytochrome [Myxococcales bacterium]|nr:c-type cytochrome [Myxococcales bacterium]
MTAPLRTIVLLGLGALLAIPACKEPTGPEREISGARLYAQNCARCHGLDGKGGAEAPPGTRDLSDPGYMSMLTDERIRNTIRMGKPPTMPAFGRQFAEPSLKVLAAYVRQLSATKPASAPAPAAAGE